MGDGDNDLEGGVGELLTRDWDGVGVRDGDGLLTRDGVGVGVGEGLHEYSCGSVVAVVGGGTYWPLI